MVLYMMPWVGYLGDTGNRIRSSKKIKVNWGCSVVAEYLSNMQAWGSTPKEGREGRMDRWREGGRDRRRRKRGREGRE